ncbi:unnamed protein product [Gordionus sp. m RMFG-2023]
MSKQIGGMKFCDSLLWDTNFTIYSKYPDLTKCFQDSVLSFLPSFYILFSFPFYLVHLYRYGKTHRHYHITALALFKIILSVLLCLITVADLVLRITDDSKSLIVSAILFPTFLVVSYAIISFLLYYERMKGIWSSGYTFNFWVLCSCYLIVYIWSRSLSIKKHSAVIAFSHYTLYILQLTIVILQIILHCFNAKSRSGSGNFRLSSSDQKTLNPEENIKLTSISKDETLKTCPEIYASFLSRISFWWFNKLALYGSKYPLTKSDLWQLADKDTSLKLYPLFDKHWYPYIDKLREKAHIKGVVTPTNLIKSFNVFGLCANKRRPKSKSTQMRKNIENGIYKSPASQKLLQITKTSDDNSPKSPTILENELLKLKPSLALVLFGCFKPMMYQSILYKLINDMLTFVSPQILKYLISFVNSKSQSIWIGVFYAVAMLAAVIIQTIILHQYFQIVFVIGMRIKTILICTVYKKALKLSNSARKTSTVGEIVNLMSVDTQKVSDVCAYVSLLWSSPLQIAICMAFLWNILGPSVLSGLLVMVLLIPLNGVMANRIKHLQTSQMNLKDERIKVMNEVLNGIKVLKLYAWELSFEDKILKIRNKEVAILKKIALLNAVTSFVWSCAPFLVSCVTFATYVLSNPKNILDAEKAFVSLALFNLLRFPLSMLPMIITYVIEARVSLKRLCTFLLQDELEPDCVIRETLNAYDTNVDVIIVKNCNFAWDFPQSFQIENNSKSTTELPKIEEHAKGNGTTIIHLNDPVLKNLNFTVKRGQLVAIVGAVGSGKSSLLSALLGEMKRVNYIISTNINEFNFQGENKEDISFTSTSTPMMKIRGSVAYASQQPWIRNANLRNNVTFEAPFPFNSSTYLEALQACDLVRDRDYILPNGDDTEIGEKGVNLSGGQKQRLSLARAVYRKDLIDVYLLDDPLSSVDVHVGRHIFENVLGPKGALKHKTRLLVTNAIHLLPEVDRILVMKDGTIAEQGTYTELSAKNEGVFSEILKNYLSSQVEEDGTDSEQISPENALINSSNRDIINLGKANQIIRKSSQTNDDKVRSSSFHTSNTSLINKSDQFSPQPKTLRDSLLSLELGITGLESNVLIKPDSGLDDNNEMTDKKEDTDNTPDIVRRRLGSKMAEFKESKLADGRWMTTETSETGRVKFSVYLTYFKALKYHIFALVMFLYGLYYALSVAGNFWLSQWSDDKFVMINGTAYQDIPLRNKRLGVYALYGLLQGIAIMASTVVVAMSMVYASRSLHQKLLRNILHSPMTFFDSTPLGRIVNRFAKDMDTLDNGLPPNIRSWITTFYSVLTTLLVICMSTPMFLIGVVPIAIIYFFILKFYIPTSRQLKRLESISRSPIYSHFQETLLGASTIRAFGVTDKFLTESYRLVDENQMCFYPSLVSNRWLAVRLEFIGSFIVFLAALTIALNRDNIKPGEAGLAISYALSVTQALNWLVRMTCDLETNIVAVERVTEYSYTPTEAPWIIPDHRPPADWPSRGSLKFSHYTMRYRSAAQIGSLPPPALDDVSFEVQGESKVGIVGRTGAGKSSLTIYIDGIDISQLGLHDIRSRITIIPQDPVLFSGTLRFNLDPFNEKTDIEIWESLRNAHLHTFVSSLPLGIDHEIAEYGENLSLGQRQLVCLARALLRKSKILVLDEATAAVDVETDELIQKTIAEKFSLCTVLTIAHRLNTVIDYDKILVLDHGKNVEFDIPSNLLRNKRSRFYGMCLEAGLTNHSISINNKNHHSNIKVE